MGTCGNLSYTGSRWPCGNLQADFAIDRMHNQKSRSQSYSAKKVHQPNCCRHFYQFLSPSMTVSETNKLALSTTQKLVPLGRFYLSDCSYIANGDIYLPHFCSPLGVTYRHAYGTPGIRPTYVRSLSKNQSPYRPCRSPRCSLIVSSLFRVVSFCELVAPVATMLSTCRSGSFPE